MLVMDGNARVLEINACAEELLLAKGLAFLAPDRTLVLRSPSARREFERRVRSLMEDATQPMAMSLQHRGDPPLALALHLCRIPHGAVSDFSGHARLMGFLTELSQGKESPGAEAILQMALGLTPAEARVGVALLRHGDMPEAASALGLSVETVRTHIKRINARLGLKRSSELKLVLDRLFEARPRVASGG